MPSMQMESLREQAASRKVKESAAERASNEATLLLEGLRKYFSPPLGFGI